MKKIYHDQKCFVCKEGIARALGRCNKCDAYWRRNSRERPRNVISMRGSRNFTAPLIEWKSWFMA